MKFVLIVLVSATGGWSLNRWEQPAMTSAVFADREACEAAADAMKQWQKDRRLDNVAVRALCLAAETPKPAAKQ